MEKLKSLSAGSGLSARKTTRSPGNLPVSDPFVAQFPSENLVIGGGVAIFHVKTARVVVCFHTRDEYFFLPKGRRDVSENTEQGAEREGFEESGYRNRLLPIVITHRQPTPRVPGDPRLSRLSTEPVWTMFMPQTAHSQYVLYWYISETLPPDVEQQMNKESAEAEGSGETMNLFGGAGPYRYPPKALLDGTVKARLAAEPSGYEPPRHENTSADEEEMLYKSQLVSVEAAIDLLGSHSIMADVVRRGWAGITARMDMEGLPHR